MIQFMFCALFLGAGHPESESRADYVMTARLLPDSQLVRGTSRITFQSGVDFAVDTLWLHLYPNAYRDHTTPFGRDLEAVGRYGFRASDISEKGWIDLAEWTLNGDPVEVTVDHCLGYIPLDDPLEPEETAVLEGNFTLKVPSFWSRLGHEGNTYQITQWYPKMCVLDGDGWHRGRYRWRGEFYSDYGSYHVRLDVPRDFITAATGRVETTDFTPDSSRRIESWKADNVHDFVWSASPDYTVRDHFYVYPEELGGDSVNVHLVLLCDEEDHWDQIPAVIDSTLLYYGEWYVPYPYDDLWVVEPAILMAGGMEYPQFVFSAAEIPFTRALEMVTAHEVGHQWFYGMLGSDEVDEAWLDEGMNTFSELRFMERMYGFSGNMSTTPDWLLEVSDLETSLLGYVQGASGEERVPVLSDATSAGDGSHSTGFTYYTKPAFFMRMLYRQAGEEDFKEIMDIYFQRFMYRHPHTEDFQAIVEEVTGRSWSDEFDFWLRDTGSADLRAGVLEDSEGVSHLWIEGDIPHWVELDVLRISGEDSVLGEVYLPPFSGVIFQDRGDWDRVEIDPFMYIPDRAPWNNSYPMRTHLKPLLFPIPKPSSNGLWVLPFPSYKAGSWRGDVLLMSSPVFSYTGGPWTWSAWASVPFESGSFSNWGVSYHQPLFREYGRSLYTSLLLERGYGLGRASASLNFSLPGRVATDLHLNYTLGLDLFSVEDTTVYGWNNVSPGRAVELFGGAAAKDENYGLSWNGRLSATASPGWHDGFYSRIQAEFNLTERIAGNYLARTRIYAGRVIGDAPQHILLRPGGGLFAEGIVGAFLPPDGTLSSREHYYVRSGPALPGYWRSRERGMAALTAEQRLPLPTPLLSMEAYSAAGWIADDFQEFSGDAFLAEAGLTLRFAMLEFIFPLWLSDPPANEEEWDFRWRLGLSPAGFPSLY